MSIIFLENRRHNINRIYLNNIFSKGYVKACPLFGAQADTNNHKLSHICTNIFDICKNMEISFFFLSNITYLRAQAVLSAECPFQRVRFFQNQSSTFYNVSQFDPAGNIQPLEMLNKRKLRPRCKRI